MSRSTISRPKSSPCCIGCVVLLIVALGITLAMGIYMYRFAKDNISIFNVVNKPDPALNTPPEQLLPPTAGPFTRVSLDSSLENIPQWKNLDAKNVYVANYEDASDNTVTVLAIQTSEASADRETGIGIITRGNAQSDSNMGITIKDSFSTETSFITTWSKPNWTFMVQSVESPATLGFLEHFNPGGLPSDATTGTQPAVAPPPSDDIPDAPQDLTPPTDAPPPASDETTTAP